MTFSRVNALGWTDDFTVITAAQINGLDINMTRALDGYAGGYYTPTAELAIGGSGLHIWDGPLTLGDGAGLDATLNVSDGSGMLFASGSGLNQSAGSAWAMSGTTHFYAAGADSNGGAGCHVVSGGKLYIDGSAYLRVRAGGEILLGGTLTGQALSVVSLSGATEQDGGSFSLTNGTPMTLHGDVTIESDGTLVTEAGSTTTFGGTHNVTGTLQTSGTGEIIVKANGSFTSEALATVSHAGDVEVAGSLDVSGTLTVSGAFTQTGTLTKSGNTAYTCLRVGDTTDADGTYGVTKDVWLMTDPSAARTYTLKSTSPTPPDGAHMRFAKDAGVLSHNITFEREDSSVVCTLQGLDSGPWAEFVFYGGSWRLAGGGGLV